MDINEIKQYTVSRDICVDISFADKYPGWVRHVIFYPDSEVWIAFYGFGQDEDGYRYGGQFETIEDAVEVIEQYLRTPISKWVNCTKTGYYPDGEPTEQQAIEGAIQLLHDIMYDEVYLPQKGNFQLLSLKPSLEQYNKWMASLRHTN